MTYDHAISFCYPLGAAEQGTHDGVWGTDAIAVTCDGTIPRDVGLQTLENTALSWGIIRKSACVLTEITIRKSQAITPKQATGKKSKVGWQSSLLEFTHTVAMA